MEHDKTIKGLELIQADLVPYFPQDLRTWSLGVVGEAIALINKYWDDSCTKGGKLTKLQQQRLMDTETIRALEIQLADREQKLKALRARKQQ